MNYANIGDAGLNFLESFSKDVKVKVKTTLNPTGIDWDRPALFNSPKEFVDKQMKMVEYYIRKGVIRPLHLTFE